MALKTIKRTLVAVNKRWNVAGERSSLNLPFDADTISIGAYLSIFEAREAIMIDD